MQDSMAAEQIAMQGNKRRYQEAAKDFQAAYALDHSYPDRAESLFNLGLSQMRAGQTKAGTATLRSYLTQAPRGAGARRARRIIADPALAIAEAADFSLKSHDGHTYTLEELRGKVVMLDFWATWCPSCRQSIPSLEHLVKKFSGRPFVLISVSTNQDAKKWQRFIKKQKMDWPECLDHGGEMQKLYDIRAIPTYILIDPIGAIVLRKVGWEITTELTFQDEISKQLAALAKQNTQTSQR